MPKLTQDARPDTLVTALGRDPARQFGAVNPGIHRASTIVFPTLADLEQAARTPYDVPSYGRHGTETNFVLERAIAALEGGYRTIALSSGAAAISAAILAFVGAGDHLLVTDNVYGPTRRLASEFLPRFGVEIEFFDPALGAGIEARLRSNTRLVFCEAPGSLTFEMQDLRAIARSARARGVAVAVDATWATPLGLKPLALGADVSIHSGTKYIVGHADALIGFATMTEEAYPRVRRAVADLGYGVGPDECSLALRGLRTLAVRLPRHQETGLFLARFLADRPEVTRVLHPALETDPGHALWRRDFSLASGLFGVVLKPPVSRAALAAMVDGMRLFAMGYSWGGFESLILPCWPAKQRTAVPWTEPGQLLRLHAGLEDPADLVADLEDGLARLRAAS